MDSAVRAGECDLVGIARPAVTTTRAAEVILKGHADTLPSHELRAGMRGLLGRVTDLKALDGLLTLSWHTDQLHRLGAGLGPDLDRGRLATAAALVRRNGRLSIGRRRGTI